MKQERLLHPFPPLWDEESRVLILGSFPSVMSRKNAFYYAHPQNRFWKLMSLIYEEEIIDRAAFCHQHHIALWDVIESCTITGSSDSSIRDVKVNDIAELLSKSRIRQVFTTGSTAWNLYRKYVTADIDAVRLPSTSPANAAMKLEDLLPYYRQIREVTDEED
ncbi:MAG: DNA-deoxyinosine glycosylase [Solobacterium sp.]|nr:DNA-deoxyinosine glycosylase [Solobacterium sp.]MBQ1382925.1 DNA-deoxyinosine glycosylase [Solobacterium sp.]MBQ1447341.1 DNA-deoxyinosine glycosylase [Solobacterium sp.]MBR2728204.1 DNA-deoxyinosine glycosylase [Solobacterium sp.]